MYAEFVGLTNEAIVLIERLRKSPEETKSSILERVLASSATPSIPDDGFFDLGQGVRLRIGEKPLLFLSKQAKQAMQPDGVAEIKSDGFYLDGKKIPASRGSVIDPAMKIIQKRKGHLNDKGKIVSHSAWRDWHVLRDGRLFSLLELKDPALARRRGPTSKSNLTLEELGL